MGKYFLVLLAVSMVFIYAGTASADLATGLVAHYSFSGNAKDESGNGLHGTVFGATLVKDRYGNANSAYSFDGNDSIDVPDDPSLTLGLKPFTIATWMQFGQLGPYYLMGHDEGGGNRNKWIFWVHSSGFFFHVNSPSTGGFNPVSYNGWQPQIDSWYFLVLKREGNDYMLYIDGSLVAISSDNRSIPDPNTTFQIGTAEPEHPERTFRGLIDDTRIYNRALSEDEIQKLFKLHSPGKVVIDQMWSADFGGQFLGEFIPGDGLTINDMYTVRDPDNNLYGLLQIYRLIDSKKKKFLLGQQWMKRGRGTHYFPFSKGTIPANAARGKATLQVNVQLKKGGKIIDQKWKTIPLYIK